ncbi:hypothetical protein [Anaeromyxobacter dehalogenans]|uniref:Uncharacterized protein n=1 Tax=Anaeromyxobacter dehalogenans (strain 2CP-C) TaxID=290397 RepID=Q2IF53_ANADE|nr:hypothetical protein [Anaeromyxobacter dehalogenans]ABC83211.1 conserved hypothetical protein [Anaeromyxobacter dehalogenans 2CP-C]
MSPKLPASPSAKADRLAKLSRIASMADVLNYAGPRPDGRDGKGPYGARMSDALAMLFARALRDDFPGILPRQDGTGGESRARTAKGFKKLDVNYSTPELGLALGVSIKTVNYRDPGTKRYTKNYSRVDNELRAEAMDYHERQPYSVLACVLYLPYDACDDAGVAKGEEAGISSFGAAVRYFRNRIPRSEPHDVPDLFERFFIGLYETDGPRRGTAAYYDVARPRPPRAGRPDASQVIRFEDVIREIRSTYDDRNNPPFDWS